MNFLAVTEPYEIRLVGIQLYPQVRQVGDGIKTGAGLDIGTLLNILVYDNAAYGSINGNVIGSLSAFFNL